MKHYDVIIVGGGAAGFFTAINIAEQNGSLSIAILERGKEGLQKVKISGGGRCNVTHAEFIPSELVLNYPRGEKELLGPFHTFMTGDTIDWFEKRSIPLKIEEDGRMFPTTDSSQTIVDCFLDEAEKYDIDLLYNHSLKNFRKIENKWELKTSTEDLSCEKLVLATGSNPKVWDLLETMGHSILAPVPSLFTFNIKDERIKDIPGVVVEDVEVEVLFKDSKNNPNLVSEGPLLITHWGMSAPSILKLSAFGAIEFAKCDYRFQIKINFIKKSVEECLDELKNLKTELSKKQVSNYAQFNLPKRFWNKLVEASTIESGETWADLNKEKLASLAEQLTNGIYEVNGKSTFKEEFVTAGGVELKEVDFKRFESKLFPKLFFAGEVLNIDAVTGGFNFQNAWTAGFIVAKAISG
ncbi:hypothetical protein SAMN03097699_3130 [Flavobacteriaceae bacterium MAR_2010_188]|nr:hypothetical protein SAMN03097699_3130 [Flavobacteriaceae bacterium MAR_2010_188]